MEDFNQFITEQKNTHMTHIEDKVLYGGVNGTRQAILALRSLRDMLAGKSSSKLSVKWDGAPAVFAGQDPSDAARGLQGNLPHHGRSSLHDPPAGPAAPRIPAAHGRRRGRRCQGDWPAG